MTIWGYPVEPADAITWTVPMTRREWLRYRLRLWPFVGLRTMPRHRVRYGTTDAEQQAAIRVVLEQRKWL